MASSEKAPNWRRIELEYCAGEDSIREIADRNEVPESTIRKRAKREKWERSAQLVRSVRTATRRELVPSPPPPPEIDPDTPVDPVAIANGGRGLVYRMLDELDVSTSRRGELEDMIVAATEGDEEDTRRDAMMRALSLGNRANTLKTLASAFKLLNEASAPQGKKAAQQQKANEIASRFRGVGPPTLKAVK